MMHLAHELKMLAKDLGMAVVVSFLEPLGYAFYLFCFSWGRLWKEEGTFGCLPK